MTSGNDVRLPVQNELIEAAGAGEAHVRFVPRHDFYAIAQTAYLIVRTGETRTYGNAILRKGVVTTDDGWGR
jgi:L-fucose mutarotase